jgi:hypothetical protein
MPNIQFDIYEWTRHMFERYTPKFSYQGETGHAFIMWQERFRAELKELLGLNLLATDGFCDLAPKLLS